MFLKRDAATLPTIYHSYRSIEEYLQLLESAGCGPAGRESIRPVDALALSLLTAMSPPRPTLVDLAGGATAGASTLLCRTQAQAGKVVTPGGQDGDADPDWTPVLRDYFAHCDPAGLAPHVEADGEAALDREACGLSGAGYPFVLLPPAGAADDTARAAERWLALRQDFVVVALGMGDTGRCPRLASLATAFGGDSPHRLALPREQAPALHGCTLGLIYRKDHPHMDRALGRLGLLFTGNFTFLGLARNACETAVREAARPAPPAADSPPGAAARDAERLAEVTGSLSYKIARRLSGARARLAPGGTARYRAFRKTVRALQVLRAEGLWGLASRTLKKVAARRRPAA